MVCMLMLWCGISAVYASWAERFIIRVARNPIAVNEAVDITIQAVDTRGEIIKNYDGDVFMEVDNLSDRDVTLPADGVYTFQAVDQWSKIFNKWLIFKREWTYTLRVYEVLNPDREWTVEIVVQWTSDNDWEEDVVVVSPSASSIEKSSTVNVIGTSKFPNSPIEFYLNNTKVHDTITESDWSFSTYISKVTPWSHTLVVKVVDIDSNILWESDSIKFSYQTADLNLFKTITTTPANPESDQTITATVSTLDTVSSVELILDGQTYIMDKIDEGVFSKAFKISQAWEYPIDLKISAWDNIKTYQKVKSINVQASTAAITAIKHTRDPKNLSNITLDRTIKGNFDRYRVMYGTNNSNLNQNILATTNRAQLTLDTSTTYYVQIQWLDAQWQLKWAASRIITINPANSDGFHGSAGIRLCNVDGIIISAIKSWWNYYLTWPSIAWVDKYTIYKSDQPNTLPYDATKVAETVENFFLYPFDPNSKTKDYSYYTVQATCSDGTVLTVDETKKIQVWPVQNIALILLAGMLIYGSYRFTRLD